MTTRAEPDESGFIPFDAMIAAHAASNPGGIAYRVGTCRLDWHTLHERMVQVAQALVAAHVGPGDRVAILGFPSLAYVECLWGIVAARACVVPLPVSASTETLQSMLTDSGAKLLLVDPDVGPACAELATHSPSRRTRDVVRFGEDGADGPAYAAWRVSGAGGPALPRAEAGDPFNIIYSSGTTGSPKGIVHLHGMRQRQSQRNGFGFGSESRTLLATPMYSNTTMTPMLGTLAHGGECILMRRFDAGQYLSIAVARRATHTMLVPVQFRRILAHADFDASDLTTFRVSQSTGAPMDVALKQEILARWPGRFLEGYGLTEGGVSCFLDARSHPDKLGTVGRPADGTEVFLIDEAGHRLRPAAAAPGDAQVGEVVGRSPFMMAGYHERPDANAQIRWYDEDGTMYHRTGDIGRFDPDGFLTLLDRSKDVIISGGNNIYAVDLETVLALHGDVQESAVIGVPSRAWGESPMALVVPRPHTRIDPEALRDWVNARVGKTQRLCAVELRDELPRSPLGKLSKKDLRAPYWRT